MLVATRVSPRHLDLVLTNRRVVTGILFTAHSAQKLFVSDSTVSAPPSPG